MAAAAAATAAGEAGGEVERRAVKRRGEGPSTGTLRGPLVLGAL